MPITFIDQFWVMDPYNPPPPGTVLTSVNFTVVDQNSNNLVNRFSNDTIDGVDIRSVYPGDTVTVTLLNGTTVTYTGATFYLADGRQVFTPTDGSVLQNGALVSTTWVSGQGSVPVGAFAPPPCFTPGTRLLTPNGPVAVENLSHGDLIDTADAGPCPILFVHQRELDFQQLEDDPKQRPIRFEAGSLGPGVPVRPLTVSPQHRMVIRSGAVLRMFGEAEIMVPACQLVGLPGITRELPADGVRYIHVLLDHHGVVLAENAPTETLYLGEQVHEGLSARDIQVLRAKLSDDWQTCMRPARQFVRGARLRRLLQRHLKNGKPLVDTTSEQAPDVEQRKLAS